MNVPSWSIHDLLPALLIVLLLIAVGLIGLRQRQLQELSELDEQTVQVLATLEGDVPSQLELEVAHHIEDGLVSLGRMERIATTIDDGLVTVRVSFVDKSGEEALREVRNAVDRVCVDLLSGAPSMFLIYTIAMLRKAPGGQSWSVRRPAACA